MLTHRIILPHGAKVFNKRLIKDMRYAVAMFLLDKAGGSADTLKFYERILNNFANYVPDYVHTTTPENIEKYMLHLRHKGYKTSTINLHLKVIKSFYSWLADEVSVKNIAKRVQPLPELPPKQRPLKPEEYQLIKQNINGYHFDNVAFLCNTGLRATEYVTLTADNFISPDILRVVGKGRKNRSIPLNDTIKEIINRNPNLEMIKHHNRLWVFRLCHEVSRILSFVPPFSPHSCRHYFSNELHRKGVPLETISKILGHASSAVTENVYLSWTEDSLAGITKVLDD